MTRGRARKTVSEQRHPRTARRRVTVTSPQTRLATATSLRPPHLAPGERERAGRLYREQLRRALATVGLLAALLVGLPVLLAALPGLDALRVAGIPVSWLAVAVLPFGCLVALAVWHLRRAERVERDQP